MSCRLTVVGRIEAPVASPANEGGLACKNRLVRRRERCGMKRRVGESVGRGCDNGPEGARWSPPGATHPTGLHRSLQSSLDLAPPSQAASHDPPGSVGELRGGRKQPGPRLAAIHRRRGSLASPKSLRVVSSSTNVTTWRFGSGQREPGRPAKGQGRGRPRRAR